MVQHTTVHFNQNAFLSKEIPEVKVSQMTPGINTESPEPYIILDIGPVSFFCSEIQFQGIRHQLDAFNMKVYPANKKEEG